MHQHTLDCIHTNMQRCMRSGTHSLHSTRIIHYLIVVRNYFDEMLLGALVGELISLHHDPFFKIDQTKLTTSNIFNGNTIL